MHFTSAISHPQSVSLSERYVQMLIGIIRLSCISRGSSHHWGNEIQDAVLSISIRCIRLHGYTPAEILLGFNPSITGTESAGLESWIEQQTMQAGEVMPATSSESDLNQFVGHREERGLDAVARLAGKQDTAQLRRMAGYGKPEPGDLVLIRDFQLAKDKGRKLEPRWTTARIVEKISHSGVSAHIRQLHEHPGRTKRYHIDDLVVYVPRTHDYPRFEEEQRQASGVEYTRGVMGDVAGVWRIGQRAYDLSDLVEEAARECGSKGK